MSQGHLFKANGNILMIKKHILIIEGTISMCGWSWGRVLFRRIFGMKELMFSLVWLADWLLTSGSKLLYAPVSGQRPVGAKVRAE